MHEIHTTPGFIIDARPYGEADRMLSIFTRELGLVSAVAQGIRLEKSKLRYFAQEYSTGMFSLVRGRDLWRLTSAQEGAVPPSESAPRQLLGRVAMLLKRMLHGEEPHPELYETIASLAAFLSSDRVASGADRAASDADLGVLESLTVFRIMSRLGYIGDDPVLSGYLSSSEIGPDILRRAVAHKASMNKHINRALKESQL